MSSAYRLSASIKEAHTHPIYCLSFSPEFHTDDDGNESALSYFATCAGPYAHLYEVGTAISNGKKKRRSPMIRQVYLDVDEEEQFYTCAFGGRGVNNTISIGHNQSKVTTKRLRLNAEEGTIYDLALRQGPPLLCVAGKRGMIKVIDTVLQSLVMTLLGHGDAVNDLKCSPTNEWLLLSASKDHSIRLWNLQRGQMIAIYAGHDGHRGQVLCISWHHSGLRFASSAFDNTIKLWNAFDNSKTVAGNGKEGPVQAAIRRSFEMEPGDKFTTAIEQTPYFSTDSIHELPGCVDCVQFVGDVVLSKSVQNVVVLWKPIVTSEDSAIFDTIYPDFINERNKSNSDDRIPSKVIFLRSFTVENCNSWFIRFDSPSPYNEILAVGNHSGEVMVWKLMGRDDEDNDKERANNKNEGLLCKLKTGGSTVRMVAFAGKDCLLAVCDDSSVWIFEALNECEIHHKHSF